MNPNDPNKPKETPTAPDHQESEQHSVPLKTEREATAEQINAAIEKAERPLTREQMVEIFKVIPAILVMDDENAILRASKRILQSLNAPENITLFQDPREAVEAILQLPEFSLVVSDNSMGVEGFTGVEVAEKVKDYVQANHITFIIHSGDDPSRFQDARDSGIVDLVVPKPDITLSSWLIAIAQKVQGNRDKA